MINKDRLKLRLARARKNDPERGHDKPATPIEVLDAMSTYLKDALSAEEEKKIPKLNRRFLTSFGDDCKGFLEELGFKDVGDFYALPRPEPADPWAWNLRKQLEDTQEELWALMRSLKEQDASVSLDGRKGYNPTMEPFEEDIQLFFSTFEYDKSKTVRRMPVLSLEESSWYAGLGTLGDMSDDLITFAYDRQIAVDPTNMPYYFDCLANIAKKRNSETLEMKMALLASEGCYGRGEVMTAYRYFAPDVRQPADLTDSHLRGLFESRMGSVSKAGGQEAREMLRVIGTARGSKALLDAASDGMYIVISLLLPELCRGPGFPGANTRTGLRKLVRPAVYVCVSFCTVGSSLCDSFACANVPECYAFRGLMIRTAQSQLCKNG
jgi:ubiquitin carboxyl-terminal hydrolase 25/28